MDQLEEEHSQTGVDYIKFAKENFGTEVHLIGCWKAMTSFIEMNPKPAGKERIYKYFYYIKQHLA